MMLPRDSARRSGAALDYRPPAFLVDTLDLAFDLDAVATRVTATLAFRRNPDAAAPRTRTRRSCSTASSREDVRVELDGEPLSAARLELRRANARACSIRRPRARSSCIPRSRRRATSRSKGSTCRRACSARSASPRASAGSRYFPDRPDVLDPLHGDACAPIARAYPVLLSNGNLVAQGALDRRPPLRDLARPVPKPSYLFALVAGDLAALEDTFTTMSGRQRRAARSTRRRRTCRAAITRWRRSSARCAGTRSASAASTISTRS